MSTPQKELTSSRRLLSLAYIYECKGEYEKAIICFEKVLSSNDNSCIKEARIGVGANELAIRRRNMEMPMEEKLQNYVETFVRDKKKIARWFARWN